MIILSNRHESYHLQVKKEPWYPNALLVLVLSVILSGSVGADTEIYRNGTFLMAEERTSCCVPVSLSKWFGTSP